MRTCLGHTLKGLSHSVFKWAPRPEGEGLKFNRNAMPARKAKLTGTLETIPSARQGKRKGSRKSATTKRKKRQTVRRSNRPLSNVPIDQKGGIASSEPQSTTIALLKEMVSQYVRPDLAQSIKRTASNVNWKSHACKFSQVNQFTFGPDGSLFGKAVPTPNLIELANSESAPPASETGNFMRCEGAYEGPNTGYKAVASVYMTGQEYLGRQKTIFQHGFWGFRIQTNHPSNNNLVFLDAAEFPSHAKAWDAGGNTWDLTASGSTINVPPGTIFIALIFGTPGAKSLSEVQLININFPPGSLYIPQPVSLPDSVQQMKAAALCVLVTYTGSTLDNAGQIVMALTDPDWTPTSLDLFAELSQLPDRRYNGPLRKGAFGWWIPMNLVESNPQGLNYWLAHPDTSALNFAVTGAIEGQSVKIETTLIWEFYAPDQIFSHTVGPPAAPIHQHMMNVYHYLPHVMANDDHDTLTKGVIGRAHSCLMNAVRNPVSLGLGMLAIA